MSKNRMLASLAALVAVCVLVFISARVKAEDGTVVVESVEGDAARIIRPAHGSVSTLWTSGEKHYVYNLKTKTQTVEISATSREGAAFKIKLLVVYKPLETDENIRKYFARYGINEKAGIEPMLAGYLNNRTVGELVKYTAYDIAENLDIIQTDLIATAKPDFEKQFMTELQMLYFIDRPVFDDGKIEAAAAEAAAEVKLKAAGIARKERSFDSKKEQSFNSN